MIKLKVRHTPTQPSTPWMVAVPKSITGTGRIRKYFPTEAEATAYLNRLGTDGFAAADLRIGGVVQRYQSPIERSEKSGWASSLKTIERLYAWTAASPDGEEIIGMSLHGVHCPLIDSDRTRIEGARDYTLKMGKFSGRRVQLVAFQRVERL